MIILILLILIAAGLTAVRKQQKAQAEVSYWARINELEAQRKEQILATAIKMQRQENTDSKADCKWKQAS